MRPEGGEWELIKKFRKRKFGLDPKYAPNPRVLGEVQSSYRGATLTQNNPRTRVNKRGSKHEKTAQEPARYISPVDPTLTELSVSVKPMIQSMQHVKSSTG